MVTEGYLYQPSPIDNQSEDVNLWTVLAAELL